jgi:hypothetical protein
MVVNRSPRYMLYPPLVVIEFIDRTFRCVDDLDDEHGRLGMSWFGGVGAFVYNQGCWYTALLDDTCTGRCRWDHIDRRSRGDWGPGDN